MKRTLVAALLAGTLTPLSAQQLDNFGEAMEVRIVNVDVVVRDKAGNLVTGLTSDDFVILEKGKPQAITNFAEYRESAAPEAAPGTEPTSRPSGVTVRPPQKRYIAFFVDQLKLRDTQNRESFFRGLRAFAEDSMREGDEAAVFVWQTRVKTRLPMTADRATLFATIKSLEEESKLQLDYTDIEQAELDFRERAWAGDESAATMIETDRRVAAQRAFDLQQRKTHAINSVLQSLSGLDGRKVMILATERLSKLPGLEYGYSSTEFNARRMIDSVVDEANASAVTIYGFFPRGLDRDPFADTAGSYEAASGTAAGGPPASSYELLMNQSETIDSIATRTGGLAAVGGKISEAALGNVARQLDNYYSLAYRASGDDRSRSIKVKVNQPGLEVLARNSVVDKSDAEVARDRMISGILFGTGTSAIPISVAQGAVRKKGLTTYAVPVEITIPIAHLTALPGAKGHDGKFRVLAVAANADGDVADVAEKTQTFHIPEKELEKARSGAFTYSLEIVVRDTSNRALVCVIDDLDHDSGYAEVTLDLTKLAKNTPAKSNKPAWEQRPGRGGMGGGRWP
ncbi:MAG: VWA domain-containing protein [Acidobacteria bacterium]|nr:VWA domain-containing protein [Acidobacteriota bacterium]